MFARQVDAYVIADVEAAEAIALNCTGRLSIAPGEVRFEPWTENLGTGRAPAADARPVVHRADNISLTEHHIEWWVVLPVSFGSQLMVIDSQDHSARQANIRVGSRRLHRRVRRALRACGFRVEVIAYPRPDEGSTLELE